MQPQIVIPDISGYHNKDIQKIGRNYVSALFPFCLNPSFDGEVTKRNPEYSRGTVC